MSERGKRRDAERGITYFIFQADVHARATGRHICSRCSLCWSASLELGPAAARAGVVMVVAVSVGSVAVAGPAVEAARQNGIGAPT